jgi:hypothetical protein
MKAAPRDSETRSDRTRDEPGYSVGEHSTRHRRSPLPRYAEFQIPWHFQLRHVLGPIERCRAIAIPLGDCMVRPAPSCNFGVRPLARIPSSAVTSSRDGRTRQHARHGPPSVSESPSNAPPRPHNRLVAGSIPAGPTQKAQCKRSSVPIGPHLT